MEFSQGTIAPDVLAEAYLKEEQLKSSIVFARYVAVSGFGFVVVIVVNAIWLFLMLLVVFCLL